MADLVNIEEVPVRGGRLYCPPEDENNPDNREVLHPETDSTQVLMSNGRPLSETISGAIVMSQEKPEQACIWAKIERIDDPDLDE